MNSQCNCNEYKTVELESKQQEAAIPRALGILAQNLSELNTLVKELSSRLEPVMRNVTEKEATKEELSVSVDSLIVQDICAKTDNIRWANSILSDILTRLQV